MKNRKNCLKHSCSEVALSTSRSYTDCKSKGRKSDILDRSAALVQTYNTLFKKNVYHFGDADSYFKKTLRNYTEFILPTPRKKTSAKAKRRPKSQLGQGDYSKSKLLSGGSAVSVKSTFQTEQEIEEEDIFYSPTSQNEHTMEEEGDGIDDDVLLETEELVMQTTKEMNQIEEDMATPKDDTAILKEVEECEAQCMEIYKILSELKKRVGELISKTERTPSEDQELEAKQKLLNEKMALLEQKTRRIELLVGKAKKPDFDKPYDEDALPKVVVCGLADNNMPKFIICDDKKRRQEARKPPCTPLSGMSPTCPAARPICPGLGQRQPCTPPARMPCPGTQICPGLEQQQTFARPTCPGPQTCPGQQHNLIGTITPMPQYIPQIAKKLSDSYCMQERLAQENADLEGKRYKLQEDLLCKDQTVENLQRQLSSLQSELRMVVKENGLLNSKLQESLCPAANTPVSPPPSPRSCSCCSPCRPSGDKKMQPCGKNRGVCPAVEAEEKNKLEKQLTEMEAEVRAIQNELSTVRQERIHLEQHRRMLSPMTAAPLPCPSPCLPCPRGDNTQLKELREQYNTLQDDYKSKMCEVAGLRTDVDKLKCTCQEALEAKKVVDDRVKELESILRDSKLSATKNQCTKEHIMELEQQMNVAKQRFREAQDELEELRVCTDELQCQVNEYRNKYLEAQQTVEEQRRQIDMMELENNRIGEQVNLEIQRVKNQFQEKLQELTPLPDILKATQVKLQEAQQMHMLAERNNEALLRDIQAMRDKAVLIADEIERTRSNSINGETEKQSMQERSEELEKLANALQAEVDSMTVKMNELQETADDAEKRASEKLHEIAQLNAEVENVREESARVVARTKDRCECVRRSMQNQIADLEKQLAQSRAQAKAAQKDRDDIRQKMQSQINNLNENFEDAQMRIKTLQGHVNFLKNSAAVYPSMEQIPTNNLCTNN